jgi:UDP-glucose 4-epimerase
MDRGQGRQTIRTIVKALVTGGAGFIGSHLTEALLARGDQVAVIDDLSTGRKENLAAVLSDPRLRFAQDTILDGPRLGGLVADCDVVFHLASAVGVRLVIDHPVRTIETIVAGTDLVLRHARQYHRPVVITSSSEVYGKAEKVPFSEGDDVVLGPTNTRRWLYACAKMLDEFLALAHWHESRQPVVCARLFNTVGPRQTGQYGMVLPRFVQQALAHQPVSVYGDGTQTRCFTAVADVVDALIKLAACPQALGRVVNIGSAEEVTINHLAQRVIELTGSKSPIEHIPYDQAYIDGFEDMLRRVPDLTVARQFIGYQPHHSLDEIIASVVQYWQAHQIPA